jgi:aminoglycoside phosphotransferase (APT) family kinase protein
VSRLDEEAVKELVRERAPLYFGSSIAPKLRIVRIVNRRFAKLYFVRASIAGKQHKLVAKVCYPVPSRRRRGVPRLLIPPESVSAGAQQFEALRRIETGFSAIGDPRFRVVRALDHTEDPDTLVMEMHAGDALDRRLASYTLFRRGSTDRLVRACENTGAWLRAYHGLSDMPDRPTAYIHAHEFIASAESLVSKICMSDEIDSGEASRILDLICSAAESQLRDEQPVTILHGDFVLRNVLVGSDESVAVIDTRAPWRAPPEFDIARFLISIKCGLGQVLTRGRLQPTAMVSMLEEAFLKAYYASDIPRPRVRLYEALRVLEMWALAAHHRSSARSMLKYRIKSARLHLLSRFYSPRLDALIREVSP